jgi:cytochrome d ubiquinol oxidase subunit II
MTLAVALIAVIWGAVTAYAVLGGADFGGGVLYLLARGADAERERAAITRAMGPVWEANHVWVIFALTGLFSAFPTAFAALGRALLVPATIALVAIVVRGATFAFAAAANHPDVERRLGRLFGLASVMAPVALGLAAGAVGRGCLHWLGAFPAAVAALGLALCTALAGTFMAAEMTRARERELAAAFRRRAHGATAATVVLAPAALAVAAVDAPALFGRLTGRAVPEMLIAAVALSGTLAALRRRLDRLARAALVLAACAVIWAWGIAQYPRLAGPCVTVARTAAGGAELTAVAIALGGGFTVLVPSLWLLFVAFRRRPVEVRS